MIYLCTNDVAVIAFHPKYHAMVNAIHFMKSYAMENAKALIFNAMESASIKMHQQQTVIELAPQNLNLGFVIPIV